jgi:Ca2+-binding EF-hand superfamily protein
MAFRHGFWAVGLLASLAFVCSETASNAKGGCAALGTIDRDNDGTIDLKEARQAASALFDQLDTNKDGTLSLKELKPRLSKRDFSAGDPDKDRTLTKDEYLSIIEMRFNEADKDKEGTLDCKELQSRSGRTLLRLLK